MTPLGEMEDEKICLAQSRNGDHAAFATLIRAHQEMIHSLTYRMTGSVADCKDLAQETFIRAYQQLGSYQGNSKFSSWLYRIAVNACLDWQRREVRRSRLHSNWGDFQATEESHPPSEGDNDELSKQVQAALMKLPEKQRAAIVLTVYGGHNHAEAGKILGCSETTVSWRIFSARRKLKKLFSQKGDRNE
jgi:RNA polymerase sigma-70 factor (ECF subfamily)